MYSTVHKSIGAFKIDNGHWFTYRKVPDNDTWAISRNFTHIIDVGTDASRPESRYANVLKTCVHVIVDEDFDGTPIIETWKIVKRELHD